MAEPPILTLAEVSLSFGGDPLLVGASLAVHPGERIALVGRNGSGKSTLMKLMAGLVAADAGTRFVRPGLSVYGLSPVPHLATAAQLGLRPAMRVTARVALVKRVPAGQGVSYGHTYSTPRETTLLDIPLGYADGVPRHASGTGPVQVRGSRFAVAGRVCMDQFVVDVGDLPAVAGEEVVLFGPGDEGEPTAQDWADAQAPSWEPRGRVRK